MELQPKIVIDELSRRVQALVLENVVLSSQIVQLQAQLAEQDKSSDD